MNIHEQFVLSTPQETLIATVVMDDWMEKCSFQHGVRRILKKHRVADLWPLPILLASFRSNQFSKLFLQPLKHPNMASYILSKLYFKLSNHFFGLILVDLEGIDSRWMHFFLVPSCSLHVNNIFLPCKKKKHAVLFFMSFFFGCHDLQVVPIQSDLAQGRCKTFELTSPGGPARKKPSTWPTKLGWRHPTWCLGPADIILCIQENRN